MGRVVLSPKKSGFLWERQAYVSSQYKDIMMLAAPGKTLISAVLTIMAKKPWGAEYRHNRGVSGRTASVCVFQVKDCHPHQSLGTFFLVHKTQPTE